MRQRYVLLLLITLSLIAPFAGAVAAESIREEVTLTRLDRLEATVEFIFSKRQMDSIQEEHVRMICNRAHFSSCDAVVDRLHNAITVTASMRPTIVIDTVEDAGGGKLRAVFAHRYAPLQHVLATRVSTQNTRLTIHYPTHSFSFDKPVMEEMRNTFTITFNHQPFPFDFGTALASSNEDLIVGDTIDIPEMHGELCYSALFFGTTKVFHTTTVGCQKMYLPSGGAPTGVEPAIHVLSYSKDNVQYSTFGPEDVPIEPSSMALALSLEQRVIKLGRPVRIDITTDEEAEWCEVVIMDSLLNPLGTVRYESCDEILVGTRTSWLPGLHYFRVTVHAGSKHASASESVTLEPSGHEEGPGFDVEKDVFTAGESVTLHSSFRGRGLYCTTRLYDLEYNLVSEVDSFGCERATVDLDETLAAGSYIIKTDMYEKGRLKGFESTIIQIKPWSPLPGTLMERLCSGSFFRLEDERIPCLVPGRTCTPTSLQLPLCLCFDKSGNVKDSCNYADVCTKDGCRERAIPPYTVIMDGTKCVARRGTHVLPCVGPGELCSGSCLCVDRFRSPISTCNENSLCTPTGCSAPEIVFDVEEVEPVSARRSDLANGIDMTWHGVLKYHDRITAGEGFTVRSRLGDADESATIDASGDGRVTVYTHLATQLKEGETEAYLLFEREEAKLLVKRQFSVQYDDPGLLFEIVDVEPEALDAERLRGEQSLRVRMRVYDEQGHDVVSLPISAFDMVVDGVLVRSISAKFIDDMWTVVGTLWAEDLPPGPRRLTLSVDHLGRSRKIERSIDVMRKAPLDVSIMKVDPGTKQKPLFLMIVGIGFDMDVYVELQGSESLSKNDVTISLNKKDISDTITYIVSTAKGPKIHLSNVRLCPDHPPRPNSEIPFEVQIRTGDETASDKTRLVVRGNPGDWSNLGQTGCDAR